MKASHRWSLYALAASLTAGAMAWVDPAVDGPVPPVSARISARPVQLGGPRVGNAWELPRRLSTVAEADPFDGGELQAAEPAPMGEPEPQVRMAMTTVAAPPPLPFTYIGQWAEDGVTVAFLSTPQGDNFAARTGATLDGSYRVERVDSNGITLRYLPMNVAQILSFAEARNTAPGRPSAPVAAIAPSADTEETN